MRNLAMYDMDLTPYGYDIKVGVRALGAETYDADFQDQQLHLITMLVLE